MAVTFTPLSIDSSVLLGYYNSRLATSTSASALATSQTTSSAGIPRETPPWQQTDDRTPTRKDAEALSTDTFIDTGDIPRSNDGSAASKTNQDNKKLFALYQALRTLQQLAAMSQRDGVTQGQLNGYNDRFQQGLAEIQDYLKTTTFNNFTLQAAKPSPSVTSTVSIASQSFTYTGRTITTKAQLANAMPGLSAGDSFTIAVKKGGVTTNVTIDLSQVSGGLTLDNVLAYANGQLQAGGFTSRLARVQTGGDPLKPETATYAIQIKPAPSEQLTFSSAAAKPSLYIAGVTGSPTGTVKDPSNEQARLIKLSGLDTTVTSKFSVTANPDTGNTSAKGTVVDANGDVYVLGNTTGSFGAELNQANQDVYLTKYDSAGNVKWQELVGSGQDAAGYGIALDPTGGVVITGSTTGHLVQTAISNGNMDSFAAKYDSAGNQVWLTQLQTLAKNQPTSVSVDATGNVYIGGQVSGGVIHGGQTSQGGTDAFIVQLTNKGKVNYAQQFGTSGTDRVAATAITDDGDLLVASVQNGRAIVAKYVGGDVTAAPVWQNDLGDLQGGDIGGIAVSGNRVYVSGTTKNPALNAPIAAASSGGQDAFVFALVDNDTSAANAHVTYVGTGGSDKGTGITVGPDGTVYLVGSTTGTFAGQSRTVANRQNLFVSSISNTGAIQWTNQYGGIDAQSQGTAVALDTTGASVLDTLGLPRGTLNLTQPTTLAARTTLREGDSFSIRIDGPSDYTAKITIAKGETMRSLAAKITRALLLKGEASVTYANHGQALKIELKPGVTAELIPGPEAFDALGRLGISPGFLTSPAQGSETDSSSSDTNKTSPQVFGLGFSGRALDIASKTHAGIAKGQILVAMSAITDAYRASNGLDTGSAASSTPAASFTPGEKAKLANYQLALSMLQASANSTSSAGSLLGIG